MPICTSSGQRLLTLGLSLLTCRMGEGEAPRSLEQRQLASHLAAAGGEASSLGCSRERAGAAAGRSRQATGTPVPAGQSHLHLPPADRGQGGESLGAELRGCCPFPELWVGRAEGRLR